MMLSMFTTNSANLANSKNAPLAAIFARRLVLFVSFLLIGWGSAWGQEYDRIPLDYQENRIASQVYKAYGDDCFVEFKLTASYDLDPNGYIGQFYNFSNQGHQNISNDSGNKITSGSDFFVRFTIEYLDGIALTSGGIVFAFNHTLNDVNLLVPQSGGFINSNETNVPAFTGISDPKDRDDDNSGTLEFSDIKIPNVTNLSERIKYARIYVTDGSNKKLDYTQNAEGMSVPLLQVTGNTYEYPEGVSPQNGVAVYNDGASPIDFTVTLNAGIGKLNQYKIVVLLSKNGITGSGDDMKEPDWDYKYTYTFSYPYLERIDPFEEYSPEKTFVQLTRNKEIIGDIYNGNYDRNYDDEVYRNNRGHFASNGWYARWSVEDANGNRQSIISWAKDDVNEVNETDNWAVAHYDNNNVSKHYSQNWITDNQNLWVWSDDSKDGARNEWYINQVFVNNTLIAAPKGKTLGDYPGYKIVFEVTNEYKGGAPNSPPAIKFRYVFPFPSAFTGELKANGDSSGKPLTVKSRESVSHSFNVGEDDDVSIYVPQPVYARFYLVDTDGNIVDPTNGVLTVTYDNIPVTDCPVPSQQGFYIYAENGIEPGNINVTFAAPDKKFKFYKVVGVFSYDMETAKYNDEGEFIREPDWDLQYTYSFTYNPTTTKEYSMEVEWKNYNGMEPTTSVEDVSEWGTSWEELSVEQYVKWYVVEKGCTTPENLIEGDKRQSGETIWAIGAADYTVDNSKNEAILTERRIFNPTLWDTWKKPAIYAPAGMDFETAKNYNIVCEIYANGSDEYTPNARYTFEIYKSFLGELKQTGETREKTIGVADKKNITSLTLSLADVQALYTGTVKYARIWLTTADGTRIDPTGKLSVQTGMTLYPEKAPTEKSFGYYLTNENGIKLTNATLALPAGTFDQYQVHVALSTEKLTTPITTTTYEPNYDFEYTFYFNYPVKTKYKTLIYDSNRKCTPHLLKNWAEVAGDCGEGKTNLQDKLYVRWYLATISYDSRGNMVESPIKMDGFTSNDNYGDAGTETIMGKYKKGGFNFNAENFPRTNQNNERVPTITLPNGYDNYEDVRLICVVTTKTDDYTINGNWEADPDEIQVKYIYTLKTEEQLQQQPFVHYQGEAYRYLMEIGNSEQAEDYNYTKVGNAVEGQHTWNIAKNSDENAQETNIRQKVHTVDYYYYVKEEEPKALILPMQDYMGFGQDTEPRAYVRWYDYNTDMAVENNILTKNGTELNKNADSPLNNRGLFAINFAKHPGGDGPTHTVIGVEFNAPSGFDGSNQEYVIACDVSRYMDGLDESYTYLVHEPTLSIRYLFHIRPASYIAKEIADKAKANNKPEENYTGLAAVENKIMTRKPNEPISILENDGRTVVSTKEGYVEFSLRTQLSDLGYYFIGETNPQPAKRLWWYAYKKKDGIWWRHPVEMTFDYLDNKVEDGARKTTDNALNKKTIDRSLEYQAKYSMDDFNGAWQPFSNGKWGEATFNDALTVGLDDRIQIVACVGTGDTRNEQSDMPIIWTELEFIDAKPLTINEVKDSERSPGNMKLNLGDPDAILDFNNFSLFGIKKPENSYQNYATVPLQFERAQYGFSYPQLYGLCFTTWDCQWNGYGMSPMHGDYLLLKSMGMPKISIDEDFYDQSMFCNWWNNSDNYDHPQYSLTAKYALYDVTHERAHFDPDDPEDNYKKIETTPLDTEDYGGFLYVDAADEARTIATLEFDAALCSNAKIYYTAYIASVCGHNYDGGWDQTPPMLRFRVSTKNEQGEHVPVVTFVTGDIKRAVDYDIENQKLRAGTDSKFELTRWYQVYGYTTIPAELNLQGDNVRYYVEIDNYCDDTDGADYCIDQIAFYTTNASLLVKQTMKKECNTDAVDLNIYVSKEDLDNNEVKKLYWRIYETSEKGNKALTDPNIYKNGDKSYGEVDIPTFDPDNTPDEADFNDDTNATSGYFKGAKDMYFFSLTKGSFVLEEGQEYYISVYELNHDPAEGTFEWGCKDSPCSIYSEFFVPKAMYVSAVNEAGDEVTEIEADCSGTKAHVNLKMVLYLPDENEEDAFKKYEGVHFDYFIGTKQEFIDYHIGDNDNIIYLSVALAHFRERNDVYPFTKFEEKVFNSSYTIENLPSIEEYKKQLSTGYKEGFYEVIYQAVEEGLLHLSCSEKVNLTIDADHSTVVVLPVDDCVEDKYPICSPLAFTFDVEPSKGAPQLALGFGDVEYPKDYVRVVRVGKKQLSNMQKADDGFMLHIPIHSFSGRDETESSSIVFESSNLVLSETTDPTKDTNKDIVVAALQGDVTEGVTSRPIVNDTHQYLAIKFNDNFTFHEGFEYELHTRYYDITDNDENNEPNVSACIGDLWLKIKVVPEYVTWNDGGPVTENSNKSDNWNNDANWSRSKKKELHKTNTNNYEDNSKIFEGVGNYKGTPASFVPMKFTYVTIPSGNRAPKLIKLERGIEGIYTNVGTTDNIQYDMMVRYTEDYCLGHGTIAYGTGNIYDCEKFYGNWAKEIYFKPGAELVYQQFLTYEKVWVEKELTAGTWTLMSTPLQNTYAGDMYVPFVNGQQNTEAFKDITFGAGYSRTLYPIYQRSWGMSEAKVYTKKTTDIRKTDYSALLEFPTTGIDETFAEWSHTYNDVEIPYSTWKGFAIRAHKSDYSGEQLDALIRLPKADNSYNYYQWNNELAEESDRVMSGSLDRTKTGKLFTDKNADVNGVTHGIKYGEQEPMTDGIVKEPISSLQSAFDYQLVGNPYLCSINMETFRTVNAGSLAVDGYWTYNDNKATANQTGIIGPMQSFFVKAKSDANEFVFTPGMMIDGNTNPKPSQAPAMRMTATNNRGQSTATVSLGDEARSVETLFDSNLDDVPMVYTVANGQAVSINQVTELSRPIAFGVTCTASNEPVTVTFLDIAQLTSGEVYVVDAVTGEQTLVTEGSTLNVQPNDYGRYFLLAGTMDISDKADVQKGIMVSVRGKVVTVTSGEALTLVRALSPDGTTVHQDAPNGMSQSFTLASGVYVIQAENAAGERQTVKVMVK